jgi:oligopeptide transport system substrate-binding protein
MGGRRGGSQGSHPVRVLLAHSPRALALIVAALLAFPLLCIATGCTHSTADDAGAAGSQAPRSGGTYNYPLALDPGSFDLTLAQGSEGCAVLHEIYEGLVRWEKQPDGTMETVPCLAESWSGNADATVWTFHLRRGVMFQAPVSREVTAADVITDLRYLADPAHDAQTSYMYAPIAGTDEDGRTDPSSLGVMVVDRYTVRFRLKYPFSEFPDTLGHQSFWVWPADRLREVGRKAYARHPVGTGPYVFMKSVPGESVDLVRNDAWWDTSGGPYIDTLHYEVSSSVTAMMLEFQEGRVDWTLLPVGQVAASRTLPQVVDGRWKVEITPSLGLRYLLVNWNDPVVGGAQGRTLRQALAYGCDRRAVSNASSGGVFLPAATGLVPPGVPGAHEVQGPYFYDPGKARELADGVTPVTLRLSYLTGPQQEATVRSLKEGYAKLGITIKARAFDLEKAIAYLLAGKAQLFLSGWIADYPSMDDFLYPTFESGSSPTSFFTCYSNPAVDAVLGRARATADPEARVQAYVEAERMILEDSPAVPLIVFGDARLMDNRAANVRFNSIGWVDLWRAWIR